jgi:hypothetical protein
MKFTLSLCLCSLHELPTTYHVYVCVEDNLSFVYSAYTTVVWLQQISLFLIFDFYLQSLLWSTAGKEIIVQR